MQNVFERTNRFLAQPIGAKPRMMLACAAVLLAAIYLLPLWKLTMFAPQYPEGLRLSIYSYKLDGGNNGQDVREINVLNHYIGMRDLVTEDFTEFKWMPFVVGALGLLMLRAAVLGTISHLVDVVVMFLYFAGFSLWSFGFKLYSYGHRLNPTAAVKVDPFMPPMFGHRKLANFDVYSYPSPGSYVLGVVVLVLILAVIVAWREGRWGMTRNAT